VTAEKHNRRNFIKLAGAGILAGTVFLWDRLVHSQKQLLQKSSITVSFNPNQEFTFHKEVIIVNKESQLSVYSSKCTHLGCTIGHVENGELVCPCHGSKYNLEGNPIKGPAVRPLKKLAFEIDDSNQQISIEL
jgi:Rieske Fe-S protein